VSATSAIGVSRSRVDGEPKVRGATRFAADLPVDGLLHGRPVLSHEAHARLAEVDGAPALAISGVVAVLTADDLPVSDGATGRAARPLARDEVVWAGQPVALVVADSAAAAADGADAVLVELEPLPAALDLDAAMAPGAPPARAGLEPPADAPEELSANVVAHGRVQTGDAAAALAASAATASGRFRTPWVHQGYLEPQVATAWLDFDGELVLSSATQGAFGVRQVIADLFGLQHDRVRVRPAPLGGGFGGKISVLEPLAAGAALALRRPVRIVLDRMDDFAATNPAPAQLLELEIGADADGTFTAIRGRVVCDRGLNDEFALEGLSALLATGPYRWEVRDVRSYGVLTNRVPFGSYRAPGGPPAAFALESLIDELATALGRDPLELRLANVLRPGEPGIDGTPLASFGAVECLERVREHPLWRDRDAGADGEGVGVALGYWPGGLEPAAASCRLDADGRLTIVTGAVDMSGTETTFAAIAAEAFGVAPEDVRVVAGDTAQSPYAGLTGGSKVTYTVGRAVQRAAVEARERLLDVAAAELEIAPEDLEVVDGAVQPVGAPARAMPIEELARKVLRFGGVHEPVEGHGRTAQTSRAPSAAAHLSRVRVDPETGRVDVLEHVVAQDVGRALNPALVAGQMLGGTVQGLGWALLEELVHDDEGQLRNGSMVEYLLPSVDRVPPIHLEIVEVPAPDGPFGAKGIGEAPVVAVAPAVANAVAAATGVRPRELPMTSERMWAARRAD
jgi:CO/xanthine dehydrogenase Mo-binding subunit